MFVRPPTTWSWKLHYYNRQGCTYTTLHYYCNRLGCLKISSSIWTPRDFPVKLRSFKHTVYSVQTPDITYSYMQAGKSNKRGILLSFFLRESLVGVGDVHCYLHHLNNVLTFVQTSIKKMESLRFGQTPIKNCIVKQTVRCFIWSIRF